MKNLLLKLFAIILLTGFFHACNETLVEEQPVDDLELKSAQNGLQTYIVVLNDAGLDAELSNLEGYEKRKAAALKAASNVLNRAGIVDGQINHAYGTAIKGFSVTIPPGELKKLENDPSVKLIEKNQMFTLIEPKDIEIYEAEAQYADNVPWGIKRVGGGVSLYNGTGVAWIIDTGIDLDHPDLNVDESRGYSAFTIGADKSPDDRNGHGTHVAGIVGAIINDAGVVGVAPGATVIPVKVLNRNNFGSYENIIAGVDYVASEGSAGDVANMSLGGDVSDVLDAAVLAASEIGIKFTLSAGNDSEDANNHSPARVNGTNIYTISAMDSTDNFANFSNYGDSVDFCQPGVSVYSTYKDGQYATMSGTSMAAPHMAGILLWGTQGTDGTFVNGDPDGNPDPIAVVGGTEVEPPVTYTISAASGEGGSIDPSGNVVVNEGENQTFTIIPDNGYEISDVTVDDISVGAVESYTFENVTANHSIHAYFEAIPVYTVSGWVKDTEGSPLTGATITIEETSLSAITENDGSYSVADVEAGDYFITASLSGYESSSQSISVTDNRTDVDFVLTEPTFSEIILSANGYKLKGRQHADLSWSGTTSAVDIYRDGSLIKSSASGGTYTDNIGNLGGGSYIYQVCETDGSACSNEATVVF